MKKKTSMEFLLEICEEPQTVYALQIRWKRSFYLHCSEISKDEDTDENENEETRKKTVWEILLGIVMRNKLAKGCPEGVE